MIMTHAQVVVVALSAVVDSAASLRAQEIAITRDDGPVLLDLKAQEERRIDALAGRTLRGLSFSPDGRRFVFGSREDNQWRVRIGNLEGDSHLIGQPIGRDFIGSVAWSPDGRYLAVAAMIEQEIKTHADVIWVERVTEIDLIDPADGSRRRLTKIGGHVYNLAWSPDGQSLAFLLDRTLYVIDVEDGEAKKLLTDLQPGAMPRWSADSQRILVDVSVSRTMTPPNQPAQPGAPRLALVEVETGNHQSIDCPVDIWNYHFAPDENAAIVTGEYALWRVGFGNGTSEKIIDEVGFWADIVYRPSPRDG